MELINKLKTLHGNTLDIKNNINGAIEICYLKDLFGDFKGKNILVNYLHTIYPSISNDDLQELKNEIKIELPNDYITFLKKNNGINLFSNTLSIYGFGKIKKDGEYFISRDINIPMPFDLIDYNLNALKSNLLIIGSFNENNLTYDIKDSKSKIYSIDKNSVRIKCWNSIEDLINDCINEISKKYLPSGLVRNPIILGNLVFNKSNDI